MSDYENVMTAGPNAALQRQVNAFRAGRAEGARTPAAAEPPDSTASEPLAWDAVREQLAAMSPEAKALASRRAEILTVAGQGLVGRPYEERRQILAHMAPHLAALGVSGPFDPTDANLAHAVGDAAILRGMLGDSPAASPPPAPAGPTPPSPSPIQPPPSPEANAG